MSLLKWLFEPSPETLGREGESAVAAKLNWAGIFGREGQILKNAYIPAGNGKTVEIDLLYITVKGIFVLESKNFSGFIFGDEKQREWTSTLYAGKDFFGFKKVDKHHFYNPVWQNKTHINCLKRYMKTDIPMFSIIVFSDRCEFKDVCVLSEDTIICHRNELGHKIKQIWGSLPDVLTDSQVTEIYMKLLPLTNADETTKSQHVAQIRSGQHNSYKCPLCGGELVLRTAQKGQNAGKQFYGCSNYPKCRYTRNI